MISSLRARVQKLEAERLAPERAFIIVCSDPKDVDPATLACLPGAVTLVSTGVPPSYRPVVWEQIAGTWVLAEQDLAA
jgi:hypothetical protein